MKDPLRREIRRILLGFIDYDQEQRLIAAERSEHMRLLGVFNGTGAARVFGLSVRKRQYAVTETSVQPETACAEAFSHLGRRISLDTAPELTAVFYSPVLFNPSVLTAAEAGELLEVCVYTARTPTAFLNAAHAFRKWRRFMPEGLREKETPEERRRKRRKRGKTERGEANQSEPTGTEKGSGKTETEES